MLFRLTAPLRMSFGTLLPSGKYWASFDCKGCQKKIKKPECNSCEKMINYFNVFSIPENYQINEKDIATKAKQLQKEFHPDKNVHTPDSQKYVEYSAYINHAKSTLLDDLKRAVYMMELKGVNIDDEAKIQDTKFMLQIFQLQEEIDEATPEQAAKIVKRLQGVMKQLTESLSQFFESDDIQKCREFVYKFKYLHRAMQNCQKKMSCHANAN